MTNFADCKTQGQKIEFIRSKLGTDSQWAIRGLMRVYENQTADERRAGVVNANNGIGFTVQDADLLTSFASQYERRKTLSARQVTVLYKLMPKYAKQLVKTSLK